MRRCDRGYFQAAAFKGSTVITADQLLSRDINTFPHLINQRLRKNECRFCAGRSDLSPNFPIDMLNMVMRTQNKIRIEKSFQPEQRGNISFWKFSKININIQKFGIQLERKTELTQPLKCGV